LLHGGEAGPHTPPQLFDFFILKWRVAKADSVPVAGKSGWRAVGLYLAVHFQCHRVCFVGPDKDELLADEHTLAEVTGILAALGAPLRIYRVRMRTPGTEHDALLSLDSLFADLLLSIPPFDKKV
jgi:hypothetical protein